MDKSPSELKVIRLQLGWTLSQMASRLGARTEDVSKFESGKKRPGHKIQEQYQHLLLMMDENHRKIRLQPFAEKSLEDQNLRQISHDDLSEVSS